MRAKEIDTIHGVDCYAHAGEKLCLIYKDESTLFIADESYDFGRETTYHSLAITDEYLRWETGEGAVLIYSITQGKVVTTFNDPERPVYLFSHNHLFDDGCILMRETDKGEKNWYKYNPVTESKEGITIPDLYYHDCNYHETQQPVVLGSESFQKQGQNGADDEYGEDIICFNSDFTPLWTFSLRGSTSNGFQNDVPLELNAALGIYDGKLWLKLSSYDIVALDLATGEEVTRLQFERNVTKYLQLDARQGCLFGTSLQQYFHVDLTEPELRVQKGDIRGLAEAGIDSVFTEYYFCFNDAFLFVAEPTTGAVAMIDRQQWQVVHGFKPEMIGNSLRKLNGTSLQGNKFYLLDGANTLHIYQWQA